MVFEIKELEELFVTYTHSFIARQKGFNEPCVAFYDCDGNLNLVEDGQLEDNNFILDLSDSIAINARQIEDESKLSCSAPIYAQIIRWLHKYDIHIEIYCNHSGWGYILTTLGGSTIKEITDDVFFLEHNKALNQAIEEAFKLIK